MTSLTYCVSCGGTLSPGARFCGNCGRAADWKSGVSSAAQCPHCDADGQDGAFCKACDRYMRDTSGSLKKVTFNRRLWGDYGLEGLLMLITLWIGWYVWLYFTAKTAQTPAKRLLKVYIVDQATGERVSAGRVWVDEVLLKQLLFPSIGIFTAGLLSFAPLLDAGWMFVDKNRQALADKLSRTLVVHAPNGFPERQ